MTTPEDYILETVAGYLQKENYAFTIEVLGTPWDVYRFTRDGKKGMLAFRMIKGKFEIGFFRAGEFTEDAVAQAIVENAPS
jgi:hypothetical protein